MLYNVWKMFRREWDIMCSEKIIEIRNLGKGFRKGKQKQTVLEDLSLTVHRGEMVSIMGPSGTGKSTLLHIIGCLDIPDSGSYRLCGEETAAFSDARRARVRNQFFGFVMQQFALIEEETVADNMEVPLLFSNRGIFQNADKVEQILKLFHMEGYADKKVRNLSGGEKQRIAIARALINQPEMILADEPTGALDRNTTREIMELLKSLNQQGKTILLITHDPVVASYCTTQYELVDRKLKNVLQPSSTP